MTISINTIKQISQDLVNSDKNIDTKDYYSEINALKPKYQKIYELDNGLKIKNNQRFIKKRIEIKNIYGYDTETYKGKCWLLCRSNGKKDYVYKPTFDQCLKFLFYDSQTYHNWNFFYNLGFDISAILKTWNNIPKIKELLKGNSVKYKKYTLSYIKDKLFIIRKGNYKVQFTDLFSFFKLSLAETSLKYLKNETKLEIDGNKLNSSYHYWYKNLDKIIEYCIQDCKLVSKLGNILLTHLKKAKVEIPKIMVSTASISKQDFRFHCHISRISHIPLKIQQIAFDTYFGGRFEILRKGVFEKTFLYDIVSQYPDFIKDLPSLIYGLWIKTLELPKQECIGYFKAKVIIPDDNDISTIPMKYKGLVMFPNGYIHKWFTWYDLDLMRDYIIEITEGYVYYKSKFEYKPFYKRIMYHFKEKAYWKELTKDSTDIMVLIHKLVMNSVYGCFIEIHERELDNETIEKSSGVLFNSVYASQITAFGRWKVLKDFWSEKDDIIAIHTDSIITRKDMTNLINIGNDIGQWNLENVGKLFVINTGMYQIDNKIKTRGIPKKYIKDWFKFAWKNRKYSIKKFKFKRMLKISQSLVQYKNLDNVNRFMLFDKTVSVNSDKKRQWIRDYKNFNDVLRNQLISLPRIAIIDIDDNTLELHPNPIYC